ncbi:hypothetical protein J5Y09_20445 [Roseomonas sp. PWR1]|uniref:Uncharacterized protein n=1 Tax=Roseomonas nitratireducens TaxID=2820810 RepID=A0ABS4AY66_9PROT|nr:hypothetical protein [Neoroseomonas nitratireducens]MBP0466309.1 hypothetical protein [Neoroseomonas nitratireducens]
MTLAALALGAQADARARSFTLVNAGPATILAVEVSPSGRGQFGPSLIGRVELPPGNALHITMPARAACRGDLRILWDGGRVEQRADEDFCQGPRVLRLSTPQP